MAAAEKAKVVAAGKLKAGNPTRIPADIKQFGRIDRYMCDICGQEGLSDTDMRSHVLLEHVDSQISCPFCDLEGTTLDEMTLHVNSQHLDILTPEENSEDRNGRIEEQMSISGSSSENDPNKNSGFAEKSYGDKDVFSTCSGRSRPGNGSQSSSGESVASQHPIENISVGANPMNISTPKRARLYLEVPTVTVDKPKSNSGSPTTSSSPSDRTHRNTKASQNTSKTLNSPNYSCPLCGWGSDLSEEITRHVNVVHLDAMTPTKVTGGGNVVDRQNNNNGGDLECPLCGWIAPSGSALELHVNQAHREELGSPEAIQGVVSPETPSLMCPMCAMECQDTESLMKHVDGHFSNQHTPGSEEVDNLLAQELHQEQQEAAHKKEQQEFQLLQEKYGTKGNNNYRKQAETTMARAMYHGQMSITDYYIQRQQILQADSSGVDDGQSCTKGIIDSLHKFYKSAPTGVDRYWLCSAVDHFAASYGDKGWGCGYRNLQMLLSSLATEKAFEEVLFNGRPVIPSIPKIQRLIETAWQKGFDRAGCEQLGGKVVNTSKWIGATEIVATLSSLNVKCQLVDFHTPTGNGGTHPRLIDWVKGYFSGTETFKAPLYLQHQGHSRTIIGVEQMKDGSSRLLLFDPSCRRPQMCLFLRDISANLMRTLRRPTHTLKARQYQIVAVRGLLSDKEYQDSKMLKSEQVP